MSSWAQYNHLGNTDVATVTLRLSWLNIAWYNLRYVSRTTKEKSRSDSRELGERG